MDESYRVLNGRKARGVRKNFSVEEREKRREMLASIRHLAVVSIRRKAQARRDRKAEIKKLVEEAAAVGVFVPIQEGE